MARKRQVVLGLVATLIYLGVFLALFWKYGGTACDMFIVGPSLVAPLIGWLLSHRTPSHQLQQRALEKADGIIQMSIDPLARRRAQLVYTDDYGSEHLESWQAEIDNFIAHRILPMLTPQERASLPGDPAGTLHLITLRKLNGIDESDSSACAE